MEPDLNEYLSTLNDIMDQCKRVLKSTGTVWINLGDTYSTRSSGMEQKGVGPKAYGSLKGRKRDFKTLNFPTKTRLAIPERFYINCIDNGWFARNHIPWVKNNAMPASVKDRFANKWESLFFFSKNPKYYFNLDAVRETPLTQPPKPKDRSGQTTLAAHGKIITDRKGYGANNEKLNNRNFMPIKEKSNFEVRDKNKAQDQFQKRVLEARNNMEHDNPLGDPKGKNPGDVFIINSKPFPGAHFATFPVELPLKILKCACPPGGIVLDPFFGAGTTGVAAEKLGLRWIGIELNKEYVGIAEKRLAKYQNEAVA